MKSYPLISFVLCFIGAVLDFVSSLPTATMNTGAGMNAYVLMPIDLYSLDLPLKVFAIILVITGIACVLLQGMKYMKLVGGLMVCYGVAMAIIAYTMWMSANMIFQIMELLAIAMLVIGVLMLVNGAIMIFGPSMRSSPNNHTIQQ